MSQKKLETRQIKFGLKRRRAVAEVISTLLLVVITVVGALILTTFIDESFVSGSLSVSSATDTSLKSIKLRGYDTRNGDDLMDSLYNLNNENLLFPNYLCRASCNGAPDDIPTNGGSDFIVMQIENQSISSVFLKNIYLDNVNHPWDSLTAGNDLDGSLISGTNFPEDGSFSIVSIETQEQTDNEIPGGKTVNVVMKLGSDVGTPDIPLGKTIRVQLNIGENSLAEFLIESGDAR